MSVPVRVGQVATFALACALSGCGYPSSKDVDAFFASYEALPASSRAARLNGLLHRLARPDDKEEDAILERAIERMVQLYSATHDETLLQAVEAQKYVAGPATSLCGLYESLLTDVMFRRRYQADATAREALRGCVGLALSQREFDELVAGRNVCVHGPAGSGSSCFSPCVGDTDCPDGYACACDTKGCSRSADSALRELGLRSAACVPSSPPTGPGAAASPARREVGSPGAHSSSQAPSGNRP